MTEDSAPRFFGFDAQPWRLSGHDAERLAELRMVVLAWLHAFSRAADITAIAQTLTDLENLEECGTPPGYAELEMSRIDPENGGLSAHIGIGASGITLDLTEFVPGPNDMLDHGAVLTRDGRPLLVQLDPMGSFDSDLFDSWWSHAMDLAPTSSIDPTYKAQIKREDG